MKVHGPFDNYFIAIQQIDILGFFYEVCLKKGKPLLNNENGLHDIDETWQQRRVDWNVHA